MISNCFLYFVNLVRRGKKTIFFGQQLKKIQKKKQQLLFKQTNLSFDLKLVGRRSRRRKIELEMEKYKKEKETNLIKHFFFTLLVLKCINTHLNVPIVKKKNSSRVCYIQLIKKSFKFFVCMKV